MKSKKIYIVLIAILIIFCVIMFLVFGVGELKKSVQNTTIIVGNDTMWTYNNRKWDSLLSYDDINWKKFDIYSDNQMVGNYYLWYSDGWYVFDENKNAVTIDGDLLGIDSNVDISVSDFNTIEIDDYSYVYDVLKESNLPTDSKYTFTKKVIFDFDNDGVEEEFYLISNVFPVDFDPDKVFSIAFMVKNEKIYTIYKDINDNIGFNGCLPYITSFIDADDDSKYEIILSCDKYSTLGTTKMLYEFKNGQFNMLISNNK